MDNYKQLVFGAKPKWTVILTATACGASVLILLLKWFGHQQSWKKIQKAKVRREKSLQRAEHAVCQFNESHPETDTSLILSLSLAELSKQLKDGALTPQAVFHSYMEKTLEVNRRLNCCTEVLLESWDQLEDIDSHKDGLLYGVPVSIKENIGYKGHDSTCGVICKLDLPATGDSVLVEVLKRQGAIPFVKTNVPQGLLNFDCGNPIYGLTLNPHNPQKTSGGSSGGEGALIGGGGSVLGIGSDIGGSIRIPSSFCGICGFKPTANRLSLLGASSCVRGQKSVLSSLGPMARDVDSLALCMHALLCDHMFILDPTVPPIPFNQQVVNRISACLADISVWMTDHHLKLNLGKTELLFLPGKDCPFHDLAITVDNSIVSSSQSAKNLGVILDNTLSFSTNIKAVTRSCRFMLYNIRRVRPCLTQEAAQVLIQALVISRLDYCNSLLAGLPACAIKPLQLIQNAAARLVFNFPKFSHVTPLLRSLHWLPVEARIRYKTMVLAYGAVRGTAPPYLQALIRPYTQTRALRSSTSGLLASLPLRKYSSRSAQSKLFAALAPQWWNKLPHDARSAESITTFRRHLKPHLFKEYLG
ncbi:vitamin D3 hydroxylase-associated protein-like isoform 1-T1 [Salvelinus alpinus]